MPRRRRMEQTGSIMANPNQTQLAFYLTGRRTAAGLEAVEELRLRPALLAPYWDLAQLRYDFPLVLTSGGEYAPGFLCLSGIADDIRREIAGGEDGLRLERHMLRLEEEIRRMTAAGISGSLAVLWNRAAERLGARESALLQNSLDRARALLRVEGEVVDCDANLPTRLLKHLWMGEQKHKAARFQKEIARLAHYLSAILRADFIRSAAGTSAQNLESSFGSLHSEDFDFAEMSRFLTTARPAPGLTESRRRRILGLLSVFESQCFYPKIGAGSPDGPAYSFAFESARAALQTYYDRLPALTELAGAITAAKLEIAGEYKETLHDSYFKSFGVDGLEPLDLALFPDYFVRVNADRLDSEEAAALTEILSAGLPMKVLVQTDDILEEVRPGSRHFGLARKSRPLVQLALGLNEVYVLQSASSHLFQMRNEINRGFAFPGAALFHIFSGVAKTAGGLPAYLVAAAAMESRAFPAFVCDPSAGADRSSRFRLESNPQMEQDWPLQRLVYENEEHQKVSEELPFTLADFVALDGRFAGHFARIPHEEWNGTLVSIDGCLTDSDTRIPEKLPSLLMVDGNNRLQRVLVDEKLLREVRRCREMWKNLRERARPNKTLLEGPSEPVKEAPAETLSSSGPVQPAAPKAVAAPPEARPEIASDEPYIETPRCTTCNECTNINNKMFAYNENKQAYVANPDAGTFAQLVEAAESCQVAIIHPGKPRNPNEPGLEELLQRAEAFR